MAGISKATNRDHTRESWLRVASRRMVDEIEGVSGVKLDDVRVSMGFGRRRYERNVAAVCYERGQDAGGLNQIFLSPEIGEMFRDTKGVLRRVRKNDDDTTVPASVIVLLCLRHELIHAALDNQGAHGIKSDPEKGVEQDDRFPEYATRLGFLAPFTHLVPDPALIDEMELLAIELGDFPHGQLTVKADITVPVGGSTITSAGGSDVNRHLGWYCTIFDPETDGPLHKGPVRMSAAKAARCVLICTERLDDGAMCGKPLSRDKPTPETSTA